MELSGRSGIVTGVEAPFGAAIARALARAGATLVIASSDLAAAEALAAELGARAVATEEALGGTTPLGFLIEATPLPAFPVTLSETGGLEEALAAAARPLERMAGQMERIGPGGAALCVSATLGPTSEGGWLAPMLAWRAAAVVELAREAAPRRVRVNGLAPVSDGGARLPGFLKREASRPATPIGRAANPDDVAEAALWLLGAGMATGLTLPLDGGRGL